MKTHGMLHQDWKVIDHFSREKPKRFIPVIDIELLRRYSSCKQRHVLFREERVDGKIRRFVVEKPKNEVERR